MIQELQTERLDINNKYDIDFSCKQLDDIILKIIVYDKSLPADLSNYNCRLKAFKRDQVPLIQNTNITIKDNVVTIKADKQLTTTNGIVKAELQFINKTTLEKKSTFYINIEVVASVLDVDGTVSTPTCTILEEIDHKLDEIENIGEVLDQAKEVRDTLQNTTIPTGININSKLETNTKNASTKITEVENIITDASNKIEEVETSVNNANTCKKGLDLSKTNADISKENLDTANVQAEKNIEELNKIGDVKDLAAKVETNKNNIENLQEKVEDNTSQLKEKANLKDVKIFSCLADIGLTQNDMTTDFSNNVLKIIKAMGKNRRLVLYPYDKESNTNLYQSVKAWCGVNTDALTVIIDSSFNGATNLPNKIKVYPNTNDGNNKYFIGFFDNQLGRCREIQFADDTGWIDISSTINSKATGTVKIRRIRNEVFFQIRYKGIINENEIVATMPAEYAPKGQSEYVFCRFPTGIITLDIQPNGRVMMDYVNVNTQKPDFTCCARTSYLID
ncbi:viral A-type inclusion protein [Clostridium botulinum]|uniref:viral A-type inclusion protein n=1 Tax=Clostridium TaxID=1485 RepID=UPI0013F79F61|nr:MULTISPECIES: viral A-type inclusion protein [Clostridium]MCS6103477.1 viral A-type inclusion protein [Clostridium botulinum]MCS6106504.1 viral A-type inclusion protein [Clostridium botulinum]MCS6131711.1 viral A-type inclusion protein [Clostridium botulinum]NFL44983.1 viral A-type inclusion protein [Clostridium botulinum]NFL89614.1 viral A-type inclusion protein [Clostridium botulinum]